MKDTELESKVNSWWNYLSEEEQNVLINLLYRLDLRDFVSMDNDGKILKILA